MTHDGPKSACRVMRSVALVTAIAVLAACGRHGQGESTASTDAGALNATNPPTCFIPVGHLDDNNAKLFSATEAGDVAGVHAAITAGANVNATDLLSRTPLFAAAFCNRVAVTNELIDQGAQVDGRDFDGLSPLHIAAIVGGVDVARALLNRGADINGRGAHGRTPLHFAAAVDSAAMVDLLISSGAQVGLRDKDGQTAASVALENGHQAIAATLKALQAKARAVTIR
jgi:ankyrin repeat protein